MNPYNHPSPPPRPPDFRPLRRRKRVWAGAISLLFAGVMIGVTGEQPADTQAASAGATPTATITATVEAAATERVTVAPKPKPAPTVTKTKTVRTPGPTVTVTSPGSGTGGSGGTGSSGGTGGTTGGGGGGAAGCSIKSNAGNCYSPGQFCRNADHGASTTTATGERITCRQSGNAWRWTRS